MLVPQKIALSSSISIVNYLDTGHWQSRYQYHLVVSRGPKNSSITAANAPCRFLPLKSLNLCWLVAILDFAMKHGPGLHPILVVPKYPKCAHDFYWCFPNKLTLRSVRGKYPLLPFFDRISRPTSFGQAAWPESPPGPSLRGFQLPQRPAEWLGWRPANGEHRGTPGTSPSGDGCDTVGRTIFVFFV
jgi:hypothetical protein